MQCLVIEIEEAFPQGWSYDNVYFIDRHTNEIVGEGRWTSKYDDTLTVMPKNDAAKVLFGSQPAIDLKVGLRYDMFTGYPQSRGLDWEENFQNTRIVSRDYWDFKTMMHNRRQSINNNGDQEIE